MTADTAVVPLKERFTRGLDAPICLTWELTYACNLACVHCLSSSGRRDPMELSPAEARTIVDDLAAMKVFYVNIGGGEPMLRPDFFDLVGYAVDQKVGVKFSTNGTRLTAERARRLAAMDYVDVQVSIDGALASTNDAVRGQGSFGAARTAMDNLAAANFGRFKISVVVTRENVTQLDAFAEIAEGYGAQLRLTRFRPSGRGVDSWDALHPTADQQRMLYHWLLDRPDVLTGDSFFHLSALGEPLDGLNLCTSLRQPQSAGACASCGSYDACQGGCMAAKFFTGLPLDGPDPECVYGHGEAALAARHTTPQAGLGHSKVDRTGSPVPVPTPVRFRSPARV
jgi:mycofactocin radical SAM maturase